MKKIIKRIILVSFIIFALTFVRIYAKTIYDMQKINLDVVKPTSNLEVTYEMPSGKTGVIYTNDKFYDSDIYTFDLKPNKVTVECGTKIYVKDMSVPGDGTKISNYDFQMYTPSYEKLIYTKNKNDFEKEYTLDDPGLTSIYLSVMDNYQNVGGYDNWSINGNHRWLSENKKNREQMFYWYFSQVDFYVLDKDEEIEKQEEQEEKPIEQEEQKEPEEPEEPEEPIYENHNPTCEIVEPKIYYPKEITDTNKYVNKIRWFYYDEDGDDMKFSCYKLYDLTHGKKLIDFNDEITKRGDLYVDVTGQMNDEFLLEVTVCDEENNKSTSKIEFQIAELFPEVELSIDDRTYLNDYLKTKFIVKDDDINRSLILNYDSYKIYDDKNKLIEKGNGKVSDRLYTDGKLYDEDKTYVVRQVVSNSFGTKKELKDDFYVVEKLAPIVNIEGDSLYYGEEKETKCEIIQQQNRLKGNLKKYNYEFTDEDCYFEIYDESNHMIYSSDGIVKIFKANDKYNIKENNKESIYKVVQYATNDVNKTGSGYAYFIVKPYSDNFIDIKILERDDNPLTISNEIYKDESLDIRTLCHSNKVIKKYETVIVNKDNCVIEKYDYLLNGLIKMKLEPNEYKIIAKAYLDNEVLLDEVNFVIKPINKPVINFKILNEKENYSKLDTLEIECEIKDINMSEEHPSGYRLDNHYEIEDVNYLGIIDDLMLANYDIKKYLIKQISINDEHKDIFSEEQYVLDVINLKPEINIDAKDEYYVGEVIDAKIISSDKDGYIKELESNINSKYEINSYSEKIYKDSNEYNKDITFKSDSVNNVTIVAKCKDDYGDEVMTQKDITITDAEFYPYIKLLTQEEDRLKENRYLRILYGASNDAKMHLYFNNLENEIILNEPGEIFENEFVKIILEGSDGENKIAGMYFKKRGEYELLGLANKGETYSSLRIYEFNIKIDEMPMAIIDDEKTLFRNYEDSTAHINDLINIMTDDEIDYIDVYVDDENRKEIKEDFENLNFDFYKNELGDKKLQLLLHEKHKYVPNQDHPFYKELVEKMKSGYSNVMNITIENLMPKIVYNYSSSRYNLRVLN